jgi:hypothetical protein
MIFETYFEAVYEILSNEYLVTINDITDEDQIREAFNDGESYVDFVEGLATKYNLYKIA